MENSELILAELEEFLRDREAYYLEKMAKLSKDPASAQQRSSVLAIVNTFKTIIEQVEKIRDRNTVKERKPLLHRVCAIFM